MIQDRPFHKALIYFIPLISIIWSLYLLHLAGPFYLSRIDPEYVYLLNGLNFARLDFSRIGHIDHPGTPFQLITGIFIRITYWFAGRGTVVEDVISRPEFYLTWSSFYLALIMSGTILWLGQIVYKNKDSILYLLILQSAFFIGTVMVDLPTRYIPERLLEILSIIFIGLCYQYFYTKHYSNKKFAIYSGMVMGIGFITKFNFLPVLLIPFLVIPDKKGKLIYLGTFVITAFIMFLPVIEEFSRFKEFIASIITHDGLYGGGAEQVFNKQVFWQNAFLIFMENISFTIVSFLSLAGIIFLFIKSDKSKRNKKELLFLIANILAIIISVVIVSKHYKSYYLVPVVSLSAFVLLVTIQSLGFWKFPFKPYIFGLAVIILILIPTSKVGFLYKSKEMQDSNNLLITNFIQHNIATTDYFFIEPTWLSGPLKENGLVYGISYLAFRHYYYNEFERFYTNILTWEGKNRPMRYLRLLDADNEAVLKSGKQIFVYSSPGRNAGFLCNYIDSCFKQLDIVYIQDTVFQNESTNQFIISFQNADNWSSKMNSNFGFENADKNQLISDDGKIVLHGGFERDKKRPANGEYTLKILPNQQSPEYIFENVAKGDYLEITIKRQRGNTEHKGNLHLYYSIPGSSNSTITQGKNISHISSQYEILRLTAEVAELPANAILKCCYYNHGTNADYIDDMQIKYFSKY